MNRSTLYVYWALLHETEKKELLVYKIHVWLYDAW